MELPFFTCSQIYQVDFFCFIRVVIFFGWNMQYWYDDEYLLLLLLLFVYIYIYMQG